MLLNLLHNMNRFSSYLLGLVILMTPALCHAEKVTVWDLQNQATLEGWNTVNLTTVQLMPEGLSITTSTAGQLVKKSKLRHSVDTISTTYISPTGGEGIFIWRAPGMKEEEVYQVPVTFKPGGTPQQLVLNMSNVPEWNSRSDRIGFVLNANIEFLLQQMEFSGPSTMDSIVYSVKTFFTLDQARAYSINFLWGPLRTYTERQYTGLFSQFPPVADSWNTVFYYILGIGLIIALWRKRRIGRKATVAFFILFAIIWVLYDARMGTEIVSYAHKDVKTWWSQPYKLKDYRDRGSFAAFSHLVTEYTEGEENYVFVASHGWPYWSTLLYTAYPSLPLRLEEATDDVRTWVIYNRRDISLDDQNRLTLDGEPITPPGDMMLNFEPGSFVFQIR